MRLRSIRFDALLTGVATAGALALLAGCATGDGTAAPEELGVFKAPVGGISGAVAPSPHAAWYVQHPQAGYVNVGFATWRTRKAHSGFTAWFDRLVHGKAAGAEPVALASIYSAMPVPSIVQVTNIVSGQSVTVRLEDRAPMGNSIISLGPLAARALGSDGDKPMFVRVSYLEPAIAYRETPSLRYAFGGARKSAPPAATAPLAPAPEALAQASEPRTPIPPEPTPQIIKVVHSTPVAPLARAKPAPPPPALRTAEPAATPAADPAPPVRAGAWRVQAGAFAKEANARRAVAMLAPAGAATIEPVKHGAMTLYRVVLHGPRDERAARAMRAKVAAIGFSDAELIRPL